MVFPHGAPGLLWPLPAPGCCLSGRLDGRSAATAGNAATARAPAPRNAAMVLRMVLLPAYDRFAGAVPRVADRDTGDVRTSTPQDRPPAQVGRLELVRRLRPGEVVALPQLALERGERRDLLGALDAL